MYRVLLVDDEQIERMSLAKRLKKHFGESCVVKEAVNGLEALSVFEEEKSQIVIMDISMPELNGVEAAERIRKMDEDCVIIFLTAYDEFTYAKRALVIRALDYLLKPCEEEELFAVMEEAMRLVDKHALSHGERPPERDALPAVRAEETVIYEDGNDTRMSHVAGLIKDYIRNNYMREISMQDAARAMKYSDAYFSKLFKQCFDQNFTTYLAKYRMQEAKKLLSNQYMNVKDIGMRVGYYDSNYFAKVFKRMTGMIPSEYRERIKGGKEL